MSDFMNDKFQIFEKFNSQLALVTAGSINDFNSCTVGWGSMGTLWTRPVVTVYLHPARYTEKFLEKNELFTVCFFPESYKNALLYMGTHSGRNEKKFINAGLTPVEAGGGISYKEAEQTFICKKLYSQQFHKEDLSLEIQTYYLNNPRVYPPDENGEWQPHFVFVGEVKEVIK